MLHFSMFISFLWFKFPLAFLRELYSAIEFKTTIWVNISSPIYHLYFIFDMQGLSYRLLIMRMINLITIQLRWSLLHSGELNFWTIFKKFLSVHKIESTPFTVLPSLKLIKSSFTCYNLMKKYFINIAFSSFISIFFKI